LAEAAPGAHGDKPGSAGYRFRFAGGEGADDANRRVADETETVASHNLACQPSGNEPDDQNDKQPMGKGT
jgi:hypothetical protein